jgi:hypothetical protein
MKIYASAVSERMRPDKPVAIRPALLRGVAWQLRAAGQSPDIIVASNQRLLEAARSIRETLASNSRLVVGGLSSTLEREAPEYPGMTEPDDALRWAVLEHFSSDERLNLPPDASALIIGTRGLVNAITGNKVDMVDVHLGGLHEAPTGHHAIGYTQRLASAALLDVAQGLELPVPAAPLA